MKNLTKRKYLLLVLALAAPLVWSGCLRTQPTPTSTAENVPVTFAEFFPSVSGHLRDYSVQLPAGYKKYVIPSGLKKSDVIWGTPSDLEAILLSPDTYDFGQAALPMFKASFTPNVGVADGKIVSNGIPVSQQDFEQQGWTQLSYVSGEFHGFDGVPALAANAVIQGEQVYLAYIYSPVDDLVIFVLLQGNREGTADDEAWKIFVDSLEIE
jgi:hypothetical protein